MKYVLIVIFLSAWDGSPKAIEKVGLYSTKQECQKTADVLNVHSGATYICAESEVK